MQATSGKYSTPHFEQTSHSWVIFIFEMCYYKSSCGNRELGKPIFIKHKAHFSKSFFFYFGSERRDKCLRGFCDNVHSSRLVPGRFEHGANRYLHVNNAVCDWDVVRRGGESNKRGQIVL